MSEYAMTAVIASREYTFEAGDETAQILVEIGAPARTPEKPEVWYCPWIIRRPGRTESLHSLGVDPVHALTGALSVVRMALQYTANKGRLTFQGEEGVFIDLR
ncbi:MAG: DUF6968 family protein [Longimicrobiales bacterium]